MSPTQRTLKELKKQGRICAIVEKWNPHVGPPGIRQDLFGIIDIIALDPERGVVGVQSTGQDFAGHNRKLMISKASACIAWLRTPGTMLELWGWRKVKVKRGGKAKIWAPRVRTYTLGDFTDDPLAVSEAEDRYDVEPPAWSYDFERLQRDLMLLGVERYEKHAGDIPEIIKQRLAKYEMTGDFDYLVDVANLCQFEYTAGGRGPATIDPQKDKAAHQILIRSGLRRDTK